MGMPAQWPARDGTVQPFSCTGLTPAIVGRDSSDLHGSTDCIGQLCELRVCIETVVLTHHFQIKVLLDSCSNTRVEPQ